MGYYSENTKTLDVSGIFTTLKGCIAAAEGVSDRENVSLTVYAQTSNGDKVVGKTSQYETCSRDWLWFFDYDDKWEFARE